MQRGDEMDPFQTKIPENVIRLKEAGQGSVEIARITGIPWVKIRDWFPPDLAEGAKRRSGRKDMYSPEEKAECVELVRTLNSVNKARMVLGVGYDALRGWASSAGVLNGVQQKPNNFITWDITFYWLVEVDPRFSRWAELARDWVGGMVCGLRAAQTAIKAFFRRYLLVEHKIGEFINVDSFFGNRPNAAKLIEVVFTGTSQMTRRKGVSKLRDWFDWILNNYYSIEDDVGNLVVSPMFRNPLASVKMPEATTPGESVYSPLPFAYIKDLRALIAEGPTFGHWRRMQSLIATPSGHEGDSTVWFEVSEDQIDRADPDCVFRTRFKVSRNNCEEMVWEMWSPVRFVAVLLKLILPHRTSQVRFLDSGEADEFRFENGGWFQNRSQLAEAGLAAGAIYKQRDSEVPQIYTNTNKTADARLRGKDKGFVVPWPPGADYVSDPYYWISRLRNWQEKYNRLERRVAWAEIPPSILRDIKSEYQLGNYSNACFLFRDPVRTKIFPVSDDAVAYAWAKVLRLYQLVLAQSGKTHADGSAIRLVDDGVRVKALFPLHSLRVSLVTSLVEGGGLSMAVLQKVVGHSRLLMSIYYVKHGRVYVNEQLEAALQKMDEGKEKSLQRLLKSERIKELGSAIVANDVRGASLALAEEPSARNPVGWMPMHIGFCLMGGNTGRLESGRKTFAGGCFNGGENGTPVPGGTKNCVRCRWLVTSGDYLFALVAYLNNLLFHLGDSREKMLALERITAELRLARFEAESAGKDFEQEQELTRHERITENAIAHYCELVLNVDACYRLIERCRSSLEAQDSGESLRVEMIANGRHADLNLALEPEQSELRQLSVLCRDLEIHPELEPGKIPWVRSRLLDAALLNAGTQPVFLRMSERDQVLAGNAFMRSLARAANPQSVLGGQRLVIGAMDAKRALAELGLGAASAVNALLYSQGGTS
jgi:hypothetical protein